MDDRVIVVGGGICGLMCAALLARSGRPVELIEAGARLGGRAETSDIDSHLLNLGAHALYPSAEKLLRSAGVRVSGGHPNATKTKILHEGEVFAMTGALLAGRGPLGLRERRRIGAALARISIGAAPRSDALDAASWCEHEGASPLAAGTLGGLLRLATYAGDLSLLPSALGRQMLGEASRRPVRYLDGGWQTIVDGLTLSATAAGATIRRGSRVTAIARDGQDVTVQLADGAEVRGPQLVLAGLSPAQSGRLLTDAGGVPPAAVLQPRALRAACLDVALSRLPEPGTTLLIGADEPLYMSVHSAAARLAPRGGAVVHLLRYDDGAQMSDIETKERLCGLLDLAQPGWREETVHLRFAPRMVVAHHLPPPTEGLTGRPGIHDSGLPGVLLAGDWVGAEGWLAGGSLASGAATAEAILSGSADAPVRSPRLADAR